MVCLRLVHYCVIICYSFHHQCYIICSILFNGSITFFLWHLIHFVSSVMIFFGCHLIHNRKKNNNLNYCNFIIQQKQIIWASNKAQIFQQDNKSYYFHIEKSDMERAQPFVVLISSFVVHFLYYKNIYKSGISCLYYLCIICNHLKPHSFVNKISKSVTNNIHSIFQQYR